MQVTSSVPQVVQYTPVQPVPPVKRDDSDGDADKGSGADDKVKAANPPGVGSRLDISV